MHITALYTPFNLILVNEEEDLSDLPLDWEKKFSLLIMDIIHKLDLVHSPIIYNVLKSTHPIKTWSPD